MCYYPLIAHGGTNNSSCTTAHNRRQSFGQHNLFDVSHFRHDSVKNHPQTCLPAGNNTSYTHQNDILDHTWAIQRLPHEQMVSVHQKLLPALSLTVDNSTNPTCLGNVSSASFSAGKSRNTNTTGMRSKLLLYQGGSLDYPAKPTPQHASQGTAREGLMQQT